MNTYVDREVKKTINSVLVTLDRCGRYELAATLLRKGFFVALISTPEIEKYSKKLKDKGKWQSVQHGSYGILIDTQSNVPANYDDLAKHARYLAEQFDKISHWHKA